MLYFLLALCLCLACLAGWLAFQVALKNEELRASDSLALSRMDQDLIATAMPLIDAHDDSMAGASGEAKRHQVYARMIKQHPQASRSDIALAIEVAVRRLRA